MNTTSTPSRPASRPAPVSPSRPGAVVPLVKNQLNVLLYSDEFDAIPCPDHAYAMSKAPICNAHNLNYIRSALPAPNTPSYQAFFEKMTRHQWRPATKASLLAKTRPASQFLSRHRPAGAADHSRPLYGKGASDWDKMGELKRVNAYAFRGDKRPIDSIQSAGGFHPPSSRTDPHYQKLVAEKFALYMQTRFGRAVDTSEVLHFIKGQGQQGRDYVEYEMWRSILDSEKMHIGRMVESEFLRGYISTSRNPQIAKSFCINSSAGGSNGQNYTVYALHSPDGFLLPPQAQHVHGTKGDEAEIAHPGSLPWSQVMAFRNYVRLDFNDNRTIGQGSQMIFVRKGFAEKDPLGCEQVFLALGALLPQ